MVLAFGWGPALEGDPHHTRDKWRPPLILVIGGALCIVLILPLCGILILRWVTPIFGWKVSVFWIGLGLLVSTAIIGVLQWRLILGPVRGLVRSSTAIGQTPTQAPEPLPQYGTAELHDLGQSVLQMAQALVLRHTVLQAYADHVVHELKTPVTALRGAAELLQDADLSADQQQVLLQDIHRSARRMEDLLAALHRHARSQEKHGEHVTHIKNLDVIDHPKVRVFGPAKLPLSAEAATAVLSHFIDNAVQAGAGRVDICATEDGLQIADDGSGISVGDIDRAFDPFFTTKRGQGGTGMGLTIAKTLIESGGGTVALWQKDGGAAFSIHL